MTVGKASTETTTVLPDRIEAAGQFDVETHEREQNWSTPQSFRAVLWRDGDHTFLLVASMIAMTEFWEIPNDLTPTAEQLDQFLEHHTCPAITVGVPGCAD